jgi:hypothetical protein
MGHPPVWKGHFPHLSYTLRDIMAHLNDSQMAYITTCPKNCPNTIIILFPPSQLGFVHRCYFCAILQMKKFRRRKDVRKSVEQGGQSQSLSQTRGGGIIRNFLWHGRDKRVLLHPGFIHRINLAWMPRKLNCKNISISINYNNCRHTCWTQAEFPIKKSSLGSKDGM